MRTKIAVAGLVTTVVILAATNPAVVDAAGMVTGKDIKNNSVTGKDIKAGSIDLSDLNAAARAGLKGADGKNGTNGTNGAAGASAFAPPPSGTVITGGGLLSANVSGAVTLRNYSDLPFVPAAALDDIGAGRNLWFGASLGVAAFGESSPTACPGTAAAPTAAPGNLCVYVDSFSDVSLSSGIVYAGSTEDDDPADRHGIYLSTAAAGAGDATVRYVWVYTAP